MSVPRIDIINVVVHETNTPFADICADPFLAALWLPTVKLNEARSWPLRPLTPTSAKSRDDVQPYIAATVIPGRFGATFRFGTPADGQGQHRRTLEAEGMSESAIAHALRQEEVGNRG